MPKAVNSLDKKLVELYREKVTVNLNNVSAITPDDYFKTMQFIAINNKAFLKLKWA